MKDHSVRRVKPLGLARLEFAPVFNAASAFIDRHLEEGRADRIVIRTTAGDQVTYGELAERVNRCGNALLALGAQRGDRVLMIVKDCPEFYYLFWGAIKAGLIPVPLNTLLRAGDYQHMINDSACTVLVYSRQYQGEVDAALAAVEPGPANSLGVEEPGESLRSLMEAAPAELDPVPSKSTDECFWLYSSGSTGRPKGAVHLHRDMVVTSVNYGEETLGIGADDVMYSAAKLFFAYGLGNAMTFPLWAGASAVLDGEAPSPPSSFAIIREFRPTLFFGVPTLYAGQIKELETAEADLSSLRLCVSAGEALPPDILKRWLEKTGVPLLDGIGSTEALHIFLSNRVGDVKPGCTGRVVPGYEAKIVDEAGNRVGLGEQGNLLIRGESTAPYYWNNPAKTAATMIDGWLSTGDTYYQDEAGYFYYCGRNDDMLKVGGIWCSPFEIEARIIEHPKVFEAAVVAQADDHDLIKPAAYVVLNDPADASDDLREELLLHCKEGLARYKYPRWIYFVDDLPKTATGKIQRFRLR